MIPLVFSSANNDTTNNSLATGFDLVNAHTNANQHPLNKLTAYEHRHQPKRAWLFVDTAWSQTHQPVLTLASMERQRHLDLAALYPQLQALSITDKQALLTPIIQAHYIAHRRGLSFWGDIQRYCYYELIDHPNQSQDNAGVLKLWFDVQGQPL